MHKITQLIKPIDIQITIIITFLSILTSHSLFPILLGLWITIRLYESLYNSNKIYILFYIYTIFEFLLKISYTFLGKPIIQYYYSNIIEHIVYTIIITTLYFYILKTWTKQKTLLLITNISLINLFGVLNEIIEFFTRTHTYDQYNYYSDTIKDLAVNLITTTVITILTITLYEKRHK